MRCVCRKRDSQASVSYFSRLLRHVPMYITTNRGGMKTGLGHHAHLPVRWKWGSFVCGLPRWLHPWWRFSSSQSVDLGRGFSKECCVVTSSSNHFPCDPRQRMRIAVLFSSLPVRSSFLVPTPTFWKIICSLLFVCLFKKWRRDFILIGTFWTYFITLSAPFEVEHWRLGLRGISQVQIHLNAYNEGSLRTSPLASFKNVLLSLKRKRESLTRIEQKVNSDFNLRFSQIFRFYFSYFPSKLFHTLGKDLAVYSRNRNGCRHQSPCLPWKRS